ncbi:DUF362 domain-containing protein, partial [candidate division KSB1 bacterium]
MTNKINRRNFIKKSVNAGIAASLGGSAISSLIDTNISFAQQTGNVDVAVVEGTNHFENTIKAVDMLGGMKRFVPKDAKVFILANAQARHPGTFTHPAILQAAVRMCKDAGAKNVDCYTLQSERNWDSTGLADALKKENVPLQHISSRDPEQFRTIPIPLGKELKEAQIMKVFFEYDVFINLPITKDHAGNKFTGTLKNLMGLNSSPSNRSFHKDNWTT